MKYFTGPCAAIPTPTSHCWDVLWLFGFKACMLHLNIANMCQVTWIWKRLEKLLSPAPQMFYRLWLCANPAEVEF